MSFNKPAPLAAADAAAGKGAQGRFSSIKNCWFIVSEGQNVGQLLIDQGKGFLNGNEDKMSPVCCRPWHAAYYLLNLIRYISYPYMSCLPL